MDNTPATPPPPPSAGVPAAPKLLVPRPGATPGAAPVAGAPPRPAFRPAPTAAGLPPPPAAAAASASGIEMNFTDEDDNKEPVAMVAIDVLALVASVAFAALLVMQWMALAGGK